jgi:hypothetical protein
MPAEVVVSGLKEVRSGLRKLAPELLPELRDELMQVGGKVVADAKRRAPVGRQTWDRHPGAARDAIRVVSGGNTVYIVGGKKKVPYFGWLDFGGTLKATGNKRPARVNTQYRPILSRGRMIYPAIDENEAHIMRGALQALDNARAKAGI